MNASAKKHLDKAAGYVAKGEEFYRKAVEEIIAAQDADPTLTQGEIGEQFGKSHDWVSTLVRWHASDDPGRTPFGNKTPEQKGRGAVGAKKVLRETPEIVTQLNPAEQRRISVELDNAAAKRQKEREQVAKAKEREHLGDEAVDDLEAKEELQSTEYLLISARGNLRGFVRQAGEIGIENTPEAWRESCLDWIEDLRGHLGMAEALLAGDAIDWSAFEDLLEKETN